MSQAQKEVVEGIPAPDFVLSANQGGQVRLSEFRGRHVVLYFYPKDDTPGCTREACSFRDNLATLKTADAVVLGVSMDGLDAHAKFARKYQLPFPLLSDGDGAVCRSYGVLKQKNMYGRSFWGIERSTFIIGPDGRVKKVFRKVNVDGHTAEVLDALQN